MSINDIGSLKWINILAFVLTVVVNGLAGSTTLIGGKVTAQISDANPTLITPAGYVFSIWSIIYILLGIFVIYQALSNKQSQTVRRKIGWLFVLSSIFNITWLFLWQYEYLTMSIILMFLLLTSLILIYLRLGIGKSKAPMTRKLAAHVPFSVYLGWITIATIANVAVTLVAADWDGFGINPEIWAAIVIVVALLITVSVIVTRKDIAYALVIIWALVGIGVNQSSNQTVFTLTVASAVIVALVLATTVLLTRLKRR